MGLSVDDVPARLEPSSFQSPRNILQMLWQRKWLVLLGLVVGVAVGAMVYSRAEPVYRSTAQVLVIKKRADVVPITGGDPMQSFMEDYVSVHMALMSKPVILESAVRKGKLTELKTLARQEKPAAAIMAGIKVDRDTTGNHRTIINLTFQGPDPDDAAKILNAVIESYSDYLEQGYRTVSGETAGLISQVRELLKKDMQEGKKKYEAFRETSPVLWKSKDGNNFHFERVAEIEAKRSSLLIRKAELEGRLRAMQEAKKAGKGHLALLPPVVPGGKEPATKSENLSVEELLLPLILQEQELREEYGAEHPRVLTAQAKLAQSRKILERSSGRTGLAVNDDPAQRSIASVEYELAQIDLSLKALDPLLQAEKQQALALRKYEDLDKGYLADIAGTQRRIEQSMERLREINLVRDLGGYMAQVISPPTDGERVAPSLVRMMLIASILGLLGGMGLAYLADSMDRSFRSPEEIRRRLALPIMGHIPYRSGAENHKGNGHARVEGEVDPSLCVLHQSGSIEAEAYRSLRTALFFAAREKGLKIIQVTSPNMGDGKTTLTANLAIAIAQSGKRVIMVDADFRRPRVHRLFGVPSGAAGLTAVLAGETSLADAFQQTRIPGLKVLPCGTRPNNPAELLTSPEFEALLGQLRDQFDYVLVDTPPLLAVTDPCVVAGRVDGVLLTIRVTKNGRPGAERAKELLTNLGVNLLGVIVNGVGKDGIGYGYGYRYYTYEDYRYEYRDSNAETAKAVTNGHPAAS